MAGKAFTLKIPQICHAMKRPMNYAGFVKAVFLANGQNKSLMDREAIDRAWKDSVRSQQNALGDDKAERLLEQPSLRRHNAIWERYQSEKLFIPKPTLVGGGINKQIEVNDTTIMVPLARFLDFKKLDYIHFAEKVLPRNNHGIRIDQEMTNRAWEVIVTHYQKLAPTISAKQLREARDQVKSRKVMQYWQSRGLEG